MAARTILPGSVFFSKDEVLPLKMIFSWWAHILPAFVLWIKSQVFPLNKKLFLDGLLLLRNIQPFLYNAQVTLNVLLEIVWHHHTSFIIFPHFEFYVLFFKGHWLLKSSFSLGTFAVFYSRNPVLCQLRWWWGVIYFHLIRDGLCLVLHKYWSF